MAKITIDEGHYNCESGAVGFGIKECDITHSVAYKLKPKLEKQGHSVLITNGSLYNRTSKANSWGADIFISLHCNAFNGNAYGIETFCYKFKYRKLADSIHNSLLADKRLYRTNRGVKEGDLHVIRESNMDACLVEMAFIDNKEDNALLLKYQDEYATAIAKGVQNYFGLSYKEDTAKITSEPKPVEMHRNIIVYPDGAAADRSSAEFFTMILNNSGEDCIPIDFTSWKSGKYFAWSIFAVGGALEGKFKYHKIFKGKDRNETAVEMLKHLKRY